MVDFRMDYYKGIKGKYFYKILNMIIKIGNLRDRSVGVLDFGCGVGKLKKLLPNNVVGYDVISELSDVDDWRKVDFDIVVANEVFYLLSENELKEFLNDVYKKNPRAELIVGISKYGLLNRFLKFLSGLKDSDEIVKLTPNEQLRILKEKMDVVKKKNVFSMCDVYLMKFKNGK